MFHFPPSRDLSSRTGELAREVAALLLSSQVAGCKESRDDKGSPALAIGVFHSEGQGGAGGAGTGRGVVCMSHDFAVSAEHDIYSHD